MKRLEKICNFVKEETALYTQNDLLLGRGITTQEVAHTFHIQRSNASKDLNLLVKEGRLGKLEGRPVKYVDISVLQHKPFAKPVKSYKEEETSASPDNYLYAEENEDIFKHVIGAGGSMKVAMEQAKAAILYPPQGLNCLITGATGTGKTYFANVMFAFAKQHGLTAKNKELITFNCADYAHNSELLMSYLFGFVEGAFTGATKTKEGVIHQADGGMLFLDEVHRLPPEGQEMIFYFMDHGVYSRLGETSKTRKAKVRIICATTEDPFSSLLSTFIRRIPINIHLPSFSDRYPKEKVDLVKVMVGLEANRIQRQISLTEDVVKSLIGSVNFGNVGQLKSNIQLMCAQTFLKQMDNPQITITMDDLPDNIKKGLVHFSENRRYLAELSQWLEPLTVIQPNQKLSSVESDPYELPYNLYDIIGDKAALLKADGVDQEAINHYITTDINVHLKSFYRNQGFTFENENRLAEIVDPKIIEATKEILEMANEAFDYSYDDNFIYAMSLHISSSLKRIQLGQKRKSGSNASIQKMVVEYPKEYELALHIKKYLSESVVLDLPVEEVDYLTVLLVSLKTTRPTGKIGIVVAAHGNSTASSMVQVVKHLLGSDNLSAVDMPLEMHPGKALEKIVDAVKQVDSGSGVLLLVDMGSLWTFGEEVEKKTGICVKTIDMVTTPMVLEAARKTSLIEENIDVLYKLLRDFKGYGNSQVKKEKKVTENALEAINKGKAIVAVCASGEGSAIKMQEIVESYLDPQHLLDVDVLPISIVDLDQGLSEIQKEYAVLAIVGIADPKIDVPYLSIPTLLGEDGKELLTRIISESMLSHDQEVFVGFEKAQKIGFDYLQNTVTFLNPVKVFEPLWECASDLVQETVMSDEDYTGTINLVVHIAGAMERLLCQDNISADRAHMEAFKKTSLFLTVKEKIQFLEKTFSTKFPDEELFYIGKLIENTRN